MNMPKSVVILGFPVDITYTDDLPDDILGLCKCEYSEIFIQKTMADKEKWAVLYHEIGHYVWYRMSQDEEMKEEQFCKMFESIATISFEGLF